VAFIWFSAQKDTAHYPFKQEFNLLICGFNHSLFKGRQLCHYPLLKQPLIHLFSIDYCIF